MAVETVHLRLLPYSPQHLLALIEGVERFEEGFGLPAAAGLRDFLVSEEVSPAWLASLRTSVAADPWVHGFAVVHAAAPAGELCRCAAHQKAIGHTRRFSL
jgi:hypothetical protein